MVAGCKVRNKIFQGSWIFWNECKKEESSAALNMGGDQYIDEKGSRLVVKLKSLNRAKK